MIINGTENPDLLNGSNEADTLNGGLGADTLAGGAGDDLYVIDNAGDVTFENPGEGIDTVISSVDYTLPAHIENLTLLGPVQLPPSVRVPTLIAKGNELDNVITGHAQLRSWIETSTNGPVTTGRTVYAYDKNQLEGGGGRDLLVGDKGWDTLDGGTGADTMRGGNGQDVYIVDDLGDQAIEDILTDVAHSSFPWDQAAANNRPNLDIDTVISSVDFALGEHVENLTLHGAAVQGIGNDLVNLIVGNGEANVLRGFGGADTLDGGPGADTLYGGAGGDTYLVDDVNDRIVDEPWTGPPETNAPVLYTPTQGIDQVISSVNFRLTDDLDNLTLVGQAIEGFGNELANVLVGNDQDNRLVGLLGADTILAGAGSDTLIGAADDDVLDGQAGADTYLIAKNDGHDLIHADAQDTLVLADRQGASAFQVRYAAEGGSSVTLSFEGSADTVTLDQVDKWQNGFSLKLGDGTSFTGAQLLEMGRGGTFTGTSQDDNLTGTQGNDTLLGLAGNDTLDGSSGADLLQGGLGDDQYVVDQAGDRITEAPAEGTDTVLSSIDYTLGANLENLTLTGSALTGAGNELDNLLIGNKEVVDHYDSVGDRYGVYQIPFYVGNRLTGDAGQDTLVAGRGVDTLAGGMGDDVYEVHVTQRALFSPRELAVVIENAGEGVDELRFSGGTNNLFTPYVLPANIENFTVTDSYSATVGGNDLDNRILGGGGEDSLQGGAGNDSLRGGGTARDELEGGAGADTYLVGVNEGAYDYIHADAADQVVFDQGIARSDVTFSRLGDPGTGSLVVHVADRSGGPGSQVSFDHFEQWQSGLSWKWADGSSLTAVGLLAQLGAEVRTGTSGNDALAMVNGYDTLRGLEGNDTLTSAGPGVLLGGPGDDVYVLSLGDHVVVEQTGEGHDTIISIGQSQSLPPDVEDLILKGSSGYLRGDGNQSDNLMQSSESNFREDLAGYGGADTLIASGEDILFGGDGDDLLISHGINNTLSGGLGADTYVIEATNRTSLQLDALDTVQVEGATRADLRASFMAFGSQPGMDIGFASGGAGGGAEFWLDEGQHWEGLLIKFKDGTQVTGSELVALAEGRSLAIVGTSGDDRLTGSGGADSMVGLAGRDTLDGGLGADTLVGGDGDDTYLVDEAGDVMVEHPGEGTDTVVSDIPYALGADLENLTLSGEALNGAGNELDNRLVANQVVDHYYSISSRTGVVYYPVYKGSELSGGAGRDTLVAGNGVDTLSGGAGDDVYEVHAVVTGPGQYATPSILEDSGEGTDLVKFTGNTTGLQGAGFVMPAQVEHLSLVDYGQALVRGNELANHLNATQGNGQATLYGGAGDDTLGGGAGGGVFQGDAGADTYLIGIDGLTDVIRADADDQVVFDAGTARSDVSFTRSTSSNGSMVALSIKDGAGHSKSVWLEQIDRWQSGLTLRWADGTVLTGSQLLARLSTQVLTGTAGDDQFTGGEGLFLINGLAGNDVLTGGVGDDTLIGGQGNDTLTGGEGADTFMFGLGDGQDLVQADALDTIVFGAGIAPLTFGQVSYDSSNLDVLVLQGMGSGEDALRLDHAHQLAGLTLRFADGRQQSGVDLIALADLALGQVIYGTPGIDSMEDGPGNDTLHAGDGNDELFAMSGSNLLLGEGGDDHIHGQGQGKDVDTLIGGAGNDHLEVRSVNGARVVSQFGIGFGHDTLRALGTGSVVVFEADIRPADIALSYLDGAVNFTRIGSQDRLDINTFLIPAQTSTVEFADGTVWNRQWVLDKLSLGTSGDDVLYGTGRVATLSGGEGNDLLYEGAYGAVNLDGGAGNDTLVGISQGGLLDGGSGNDVLSGADGIDVMNGGTGNDTLQGNAGADTYRFQRGDGQDLIHADGQDVIALGTGIARTDLKIGKLGSAGAGTVVLGLGAGDSITLDRAGQWDGLQLTFADGSSLTGKDIFAQASKPDDLALNGTSGKDVLNGKGGNDTLNGMAGNDTLAGGAGQDKLIGGKGADTYLFNRGDGRDLIIENDTSLLNTLLSPDLLKVGNAKSNQLWLTKAGNNLDIAIIGTQDHVVIQDWYKGSNYQVEKITALGDNKSLTASKVNALVTAMAKFSAPAEGVTTLPAATQTSLNKILASSWS